MSVFHRVDDLEAMDADLMWTLVERLPFYDGVLRATFRVQQASTAPAPRIPSGPAPQVGAPTVTADNVDDVLANPLYGEVPGLAAVFSYSRA